MRDLPNEHVALSRYLRSTHQFLCAAIGRQRSYQPRWLPAPHSLRLSAPGCTLLISLCLTACHCACLCLTAYHCVSLRLTAPACALLRLTVILSLTLSLNLLKSVFILTVLFVSFGFTRGARVCRYGAPAKESGNIGESFAHQSPQLLPQNLVSHSLTLIQSL